MPQVLVTQRVEALQRRSYDAGVVVTFDDTSMIDWLKTRRQVDDTPATVAAALSAGAVAVVHVAGASENRRTVEVVDNVDTGLPELPPFGMSAVARAVRISLHRIALVGDSFSGRAYRSQPVASCTGNGTTAVMQIVGHQLPTGTDVEILLGTGAIGLRGYHKISVVDSNNISFPSDVVGTLSNFNLYAAVHPVDYGWLTWFKARTGARVPFRDSAFGGGLAEEIVLQIPAVQASAPSLIHAQYGINNANQLTGASTEQQVNAVVATVTACDDAWVKAAGACGAMLALAKIPPEDSTFTNFSTPRTKAIRRINEYRESLRSRTVRVPDIWGRWVNGAAADGRARAGYTTLDKIHPSPPGAWVYADEVILSLADVLPPDPRARIASNIESIAFDASSKYLLTNPMFLGAGPVADGWTGASAGWTYSLVTRPAGGNWQRLACAGLTSNVAGVLTSESVHTYLTPGKKVKLGVELRITGPVNVRGIRVAMQYTHAVTGVSQQYVFRDALQGSEGADIPPGADGAVYYFETDDPVEVVLQPTDARFTVSAYPKDANATTVNVDVGVPKVELVA